MKNNFKVGDKVRVKKFDERPWNWNSSGMMDHLMGQVVKIIGILGDIFLIWDETHNRDWAVSNHEVEPIKNECIVIYRKDDEVIALNKVTGEKTGAKCSASDEFDFNVGAKLAFDRLMRVPSADTTSIKVGDEVEVVDIGKNYSTYSDFFVRNKIDLDIAARFAFGSTIERSERYKVVAIGEHEYGGTLCAITSDKIWDNSVHLIGVEGLKKC